MKTIEYVLIAALVGLGGWLLLGQLQPPEPANPPPPAPAPEPCPDGKCPPRPRPKPWEKWRTPAGLAGLKGCPSAKVGGPKFDDGTEISCDYPGDRHRKNTSSKGLGLCVFTSIHHACDAQGVEALLEMPKWMIQKGIPGGGYPEKVRKLIPQLCQERGLPTPDYIQIESNDLGVLKAACATGRMPCVTYAKSPTGRYGGRRISHMVNLVHADDRHFVVLDNNYTGYNAFEWMTPQEFLSAYSGGGTGWAVIFLEPPPPMPPHNGGGPAPQASPPCGKAGCKCGCRQGDPCRCAASASAPAGAAPSPADDYQWERWGKDSDCYELWVSNPDRPGWLRRAGYYDAKAKKFYRWLGDNAYESTPSELPRPAPGAGDWRLNGVERDQPGEPRYYHGDYEVTRDDVMSALESVPSDGRKLRVTVIGAKQDRERVLKDWRTDPLLSSHSDAFVMKGYDPSHWHVARYGFKTDGRPTIYVQDATGKVLHRQDAYAGPQELAQTLRRLRPDYRPERDPSGPLSGLLGGRNKHATTLLLLGGAAAVVILLTRRK